MRNTIKRFTAVSAMAAAVLLTVSAGVSHAEPAMQGCDHPPFTDVGPKAERRLAHLTEALALTEAQVEQLKALRAAKRDTLKAERKALHEQRKALKELAKAGASEAELKAQADVIAAQVSQHMVEKSQHMQAVRAILTPEQQVKMDELMAQRQARKGKRHGDRSEG